VASDLVANPDELDPIVLGPIILGKICGHFGVKGWIKVVSYTRPANQIFEYDSWSLNLPGNGSDSRESWFKTEVSRFKQNSRGLIVKLAGYDNRNASQELIGSRIAIERFQLERLAQGDYYWLDLIGLGVVNLEGVKLGKVDHIIETGANDVLVIFDQSAQGDVIERLLPWTSIVVVRVDLEHEIMTVDWEEDY